jgi:hypothetical protein
MSLKSIHPQYAAMLDNWTSMRDFYKGEVAVKAKGERYLPPTAGMILDGMEPGGIGRKIYDAYKARAVFPDYVKEGVEALIGLMHQKDARIDLPPEMEYLKEAATIDGESLDLLLRKMNEEQLVTGRLGLLADLPVNPDPLNPQPFISMYAAESITNWDDGAAYIGQNELNMVVLNESGLVRDNFEWRFRDRFRVLQLGKLNEQEETATYRQGVFDHADYNEEAMVPPMLRGKTLEHIPFVFVNSKDLVPTPDTPPLQGLGLNCLTIYRSEADYRQNLHMQGQDTLVTVGGIRNPNAVPGQTEDAIRVGAGSRLDVEMGGDAKFIGVSSTGLAEQRNAIENDRKRAEFKAGQLIGNQSLKNESGNAMLARLAAQTANLTQIAQSSGEALESILRAIAVWMNLDPALVHVDPNTEFTNAASTAQELVYLMTARSMGAPLSLESIHESLKDRGFTQMEYEAEKALIEQEGPNGLPNQQQQPAAKPGDKQPPQDPKKTDPAQNKNQE